MARFPLQFQATDQQGKIIIGETVTLALTGTSTVAICYEESSGGSAIAKGQLTTDADGRVKYWVDDGDYASSQLFRITLTGSEFVSQQVDDVVVLPVVGNLSGDVTSVGSVTTTVTNANLTGIVTSVGNATAIANKAIALAKLADGTDGELITYDTNGVVTTVPVGTVTHVLTSNGTGTVPTFQAPTGGGISDIVEDTTPQLGGDLDRQAFDTTGTGNVLVNSNYLIEGSTGRSVIRSITLRFEPGATPGTNINCTNRTSNIIYNPPSITDTTNLGKSGSDGSFALSADGSVITLNISENVIGILNSSIVFHDLNGSSTTAGDIYYPAGAITAGNIDIFMRKAGSSNQDWTSILQAGDTADITMCFITST